MHLKSVVVEATDVKLRETRNGVSVSMPTRVQMTMFVDVTSRERKVLPSVLRRLRRFSLANQSVNGNGAMGVVFMTDDLLHYMRLLANHDDAVTHAHNMLSLVQDAMLPHL